MKKTFLVFAAGAIIVIGLILLLRSPARPPEPEELGSPGSAPDLALADYEGNRVDLAEFRGRVAVLNSWAVWCPFCRDELADFARLQEEFKDEIVVVAIDRAEPLEKAKSFSDSLNVTNQMVFLLDPNDSFYRGIGGFSMPETIFVDPEGVIRIHKRGPMALEEMREKVIAVMNTNN